MKARFLLTVFSLLILSACQAAPAPAPSPSPSPKPPTPTPATFKPSIEITGQPETVYSWDADRCADNMLPDLPVRAIRMSDGTVELYISSTTNYRLTGQDLDSLKSDCNPVLVSDLDRNPADYNHSEWLAAPYTLDGQTVYAIVHQEYHGDQAGSVWQASADFSMEQGQQGWSYQGWNGSSYQDMNYDSIHDRWQGAQPLCQISSRGVHPDLNCEPTRTWTSPIDGTVTVNGRVYDFDANGGNGVSAQILKGNQELWSATIENGDTTGKDYNLEVQVSKGDMLHFRVNALGNTNNDSTYFDPGINIGPAPCPSGLHSLCTLISLTYAVSNDGGKSFTQPEPPNQLIAAPPYQYDPDAMRAIWQPSNIVKNPEDGYYYALIQRDEHIPSKSFDLQGMCLMRTDQLDDPTSWRAWDGSGFDMRFINPYLEPDANPAQHTCTLVSPDVGALTYNLTYNTYFKKFLAVGVGASPTSGFYYSLSDDLIHWSPRQLLMEAPLSFTTGGRLPYYAYPALIDPASPSPSFDVSGQDLYLYYSYFFNNNPWSIDLKRVRVQLHK